MPKVKTTTNGGYVFWCPGCGNAHAVNTSANGPRWQYNGNPDAPTFTPSILVTCDYPSSDGAAESFHFVCHSFVTNGKIQFLSDSTHKLSGQTVDIPEWPYSPNQYVGFPD